MKKVTATISIKRTPTEVLDAFTDFETLQGWWGVQKALIEKKKGGLYCLGWDISEDGFKYVTSGTIKQYDAGSILEIENYAYFHPNLPILGPMNLTIKVEPENDNTSLTSLTIIQSGYQEGEDWDWYYKAVKVAWPDVLKTIKQFLE